MISVQQGVMDNNEPEIWRTLNECECVKKARGSWEIGDIGYDTIPAHDIVYRKFKTGFEQEMTGCLWIPPLFDPIRPERSLIGMVDDRYDVEIKPYEFPSISEERWIARLYPISHNDWLITGRGSRPDLALAKAIIDQEGNK